MTLILTNACQSMIAILTLTVRILLEATNASVSQVLKETGKAVTAKKVIILAVVNVKTITSATKKITAMKKLCA